MESSENDGLGSDVTLHRVQAVGARRALRRNLRAASERGGRQHQPRPCGPFIFVLRDRACRSQHQHDHEYWGHVTLLGFAFLLVHQMR